MEAQQSIKWEKVPGSAITVDCDFTGSAFVTNEAGHIYVMKEGQNKWTRVPGVARSVAAGPGDDYWAIGMNPAPNGFEIYRWQKG